MFHFSTARRFAWLVNRALRCVVPAVCWGAAFLLGGVLASFPAVARAEGTSGIAGPHGDTWPALLIILCVVAGLILLVRPSGRHAESKLEKLDEDE
jgi:hypothetical protein